MLLKYTNLTVSHCCGFFGGDGAFLFLFLCFVSHVSISKCFVFAGPAHAFCPLSKHLLDTYKMPDIVLSKWETDD